MSSLLVTGEEEEEDGEEEEEDGEEEEEEIPSISEVLFDGSILPLFPVPTTGELDAALIGGDLGDDALVFVSEAAGTANIIQSAIHRSATTIHKWVFFIIARIKSPSCGSIGVIQVVQPRRNSLPIKAREAETIV